MAAQQENISEQPSTSTGPSKICNKFAFLTCYEKQDITDALKICSQMLKDLNIVEESTSETISKKAKVLGKKFTDVIIETLKECNIYEEEKLFIKKEDILEENNEIENFSLFSPNQEPISSFLSEELLIKEETILEEDNETENISSFSSEELLLKEENISEQDNEIENVSSLSSNEKSVTSFSPEKSVSVTSSNPQSFIFKNKGVSKVKSKSEDEDEDYEPEVVKPYYSKVPLDVKIKISNLVRNHPNWSLKTIHRNGGSALPSKKCLRRWEKQIQKGGTVKEKYQNINKWTYDRYCEARRQKQNVTTTMIRQWASQAAAQYKGPNFPFTASANWIRRFKQAHSIP